VAIGGEDIFDERFEDLFGDQGMHEQLVLLVSIGF
jgi:hypothetical protein